MRHKRKCRTNTRSLMADTLLNTRSLSRWMLGIRAAARNVCDSTACCISSCLAIRRFFARRRVYCRHASRSSSESSQPSKTSIFLPQNRKQRDQIRSEEHTSELQSLMRISYAVFCLKKKKKIQHKKIYNY